MKNFEKNIQKTFLLVEDCSFSCSLSSLSHTLVDEKSCIYVLYVSTKFPIEEEKMKEKNENKKEENLREYYTR